MTPYRDRREAGEYDPKKVAQAIQKQVKKAAVKTTTKRTSSKK